MGGGGRWVGVVPLLAVIVAGIRLAPGDRRPRRRRVGLYVLTRPMAVVRHREGQSLCGVHGSSVS